MAAMKIVCLIGTPAYLNYFINEIAEHHEITLVIREDAHTNLLQKIRKKGIFKSIRLILRRLKNRAGFEKDYNDILDNKWQKASSSFPLINVADINSDLVKQKLKELKPDLVLVHGTSMIANQTLEHAPLALNLHWGLSPYYKGSYCTEWALLNNDPYNIGYTIHRISSKIDAGDILTQGRISIETTDTANRINMKLTKAGTEKMVDVIARLKTGAQPVFTKQEKDLGALYLTKQYTSAKQKEAATLDNEASISEMLKNPSRQALPIIETI